MNQKVVEKNIEEIRRKLLLRGGVGAHEDKGTKTSGNWGHKGRPGKVGGSAPGGGHEWLVENRDTFKTNDGKEYSTRWLQTGKKIKCLGPSGAKEYLKDKKVSPEASKEYGSILGELKDFGKKHPDLRDGTFDAKTYKDAKLKRGFSVTFHQNKAGDDPFGGYDDETYAQMISDAKERLQSKSVYFGNYGNPEVSFVTEDIDDAMDYAVENNQESIWDNKAGALYTNPFYKPEYNSILRDEKDLDDYIALKEKGMDPNFTEWGKIK